MDLLMEEKFEQNEMAIRNPQSSPLKLLANRKGTFPILSESVKGIAHDMRNFLAAISGYLELVKMNPQEKDLIDDALKSVELATKLNLRLLNQTRKEPIKVNISSVIERTAIAIIGASNIKLSLIMCPNMEDLFIDELLLERALQNIMVNSIHAMPDGGTINISTCLIEHGNQVIATLQQKKYIQISIKDSGCGISKENMNLIMEPYFSSRKNGLGIGLAIVKEIINSLNGTIDVASEEGFGTMMVIYLPI